MTATDGCNDITAEVQQRESFLRVSNRVSTVVECPSYARLPENGDQVEMHPGGSELIITDQAGSSAKFVALDSLPLATSGDIRGKWIVADEARTPVTFGETLRIGSCSWGWHVDDGRLTGVTSSTESTSCGVTLDVSLALFKLLSEGVVVYGSAQSGLYLAGTGTVMLHLTAA